MPTVNLPLTQQQAQNLLILIDLGLKAGGLKVAAQAVLFQALITEAVRRADSAESANNPVGLSPDGTGPG